MTQRTAANRYARALFDVALKERQDLATIDRELTAFLDLLRRNPTFETVLLNPAIPAPHAARIGRPDEPGTGQAAAEVGSGEVGSGEVGSGEVGSAKVR